MGKIEFCNLRTINRPFDTSIREGLESILDSGRFIGGSHVLQLEKNLASTIGTEFAVGTGNGLDALKLALKALVLNGFLKEGDKILVPANTYIASVLAIIQARLRPVPADIDPCTMNVTADTLERSMEPGVKAVMLVHLYGRAAWDSDIKQWVKRHNMVVVEDNAQAIGAMADCTGLSGESAMTGALGHAAAFSFYPTKNIGAIGDGGAVTTGIPEIASTVKALANYGSDRRFHNIFIGYNSRLDPIQAMAVNIKLPWLDTINTSRRSNAAILNDGIRNLFVEKPLFQQPGLSMVWHQYVVTIGNGRRDEFRDFLNNCGIETDVHYPMAVFDQPCLRNEFGANPNVNTARRLARSIVSLPVNQTLSAADMQYVASAVNEFGP